MKGSKYERGVMERAAALCGRHAQPDGTVPAWVFRTVAAQIGVAPRTIERWWTHRGVPNPPSPVPTREDLLAIAAHHGNLKAAHQQRQRDGLSLSYSQFYRRFDNLPMSVRQGLVKGAHVVKNYTVQGRYVADSRMDLGHFDHTELDIEVMHEGRPVRPGLSALIDDKTRFVVATALTFGDGVRGAPTTECVIAMIAGAAQGQIGPDGLRYGGVFRALMFDNAKEHLANAVRNGLEHLLTVARPIPPGTPEHNGKVEALMRTSNRFLTDKYGFIHGLPDRYGRSELRHPEGMLPARVFVDLWREFSDYYNFERPHSGIRGLTPAAAFMADPAALEFISEDLARTFFAGDPKPRKIGKNGVSFDGINYVAPELNDYWTRTSPYVRIRFLPNDRSFVDLYSNVDGSYLGRAVPQGHQSLETMAKQRRYRETKARTVSVILKESAARARTKAYAEAERIAIEIGEDPFGAPADDDMTAFYESRLSGDR